MRVNDDDIVVLSYSLRTFYYRIIVFIRRIYLQELREEAQAKSYRKGLDRIRSEIQQRLFQIRIEIWNN